MAKRGDIWCKFEAFFGILLINMQNIMFEISTRANITCKCTSEL